MYCFTSSEAASPPPDSGHAAEMKREPLRFAISCCTAQRMVFRAAMSMTGNNDVHNCCNFTGRFKRNFTGRFAHQNFSLFHFSSQWQLGRLQLSGCFSTSASRPSVAMAPKERTMRSVH
ncbi:hypothetical protein GQ600_23642 [Phytophthora cactorum]|nr:hypothetical protein GQ600_23642 [Phytophthora cactorum]